MADKYSMMGKTEGLFERYYRLKFGAKLCLLTVAGVFTFTLVTYILIYRSLGGTYAEAIYTIQDLKVRIFPLLFASFYSIFILAVVTGAIALIAVLFSHKIAGPLYRLERSLEDIGAGDLTVHTKFRGYDQLRALADDMNEMVRSLNHTSRTCVDAVEDLKRGEIRLREALDAKSPDRGELAAAVADIRRAVGVLKSATTGLRAEG